MKEPLARITSARPLESASTVANRWKTRTGSSELSTVTPDPSRMREVTTDGIWMGNELALNRGASRHVVEADVLVFFEPLSASFTSET